MRQKAHCHGFCVVAVQRTPILQWQKASWMTNGSLSSVQMYVQLEFALQTFWKIHLWLANCLMSYFGAIFFSFLLFFSPGLPLSLVTFFSIPPSQQSLIEVEPISAYAVFKQTQSIAVLFLLLLLLLLPSSFLWFTWTFLAPRNIC